MKDFIAANQDWLVVSTSPRGHDQVHPPLHPLSITPHSRSIGQRLLNPQESIWAPVKRTIVNLATAVKRSLKKPQYRPHLIGG
nr:hypothetical protein [Streptomyces fulvorobeus]